MCILAYRSLVSVSTPLELENNSNYIRSDINNIQFYIKNNIYPEISGIIFSYFQTGLIAVASSSNNYLTGKLGQLKLILKKE